MTPQGELSPTLYMALVDEIRLAYLKGYEAGKKETLKKCAETVKS